MTKRIDFDAARVARREALGAGPTLVVGGGEFELPVELPFEIAERFAELAALQQSESEVEGDDEAQAARMSNLTRLTSQLVETLLGTEANAAFCKERPSLSDITFIVEAVTQAYGFGSSGESPASPA